MPLSYMQEMCIRDRNGNCRCPYCGKYRRYEDFVDQDGHVGLRDGHVNVAPACRECMRIGMKRIVVVRIDSCRQCPHFCRMTMKCWHELVHGDKPIIAPGKDFPKYCPLPGAED